MGNATVAERTTEKRDVVIVGGGPAGLSAAIMLGRCRRNVILFDTGKPRNASSLAMHGYPTREGMDPAAWLLQARSEVDRYGVERRDDEVVSVDPQGNMFEVRTAKGERFVARKVLIATGVCDNIPRIAGIERMYGISVFHCPYCDGYEMTGKPLAAYGQRNKAVALALNLRTWSDDVILFTDGPHGLRGDGLRKLEQAGIPIRSARIRSLEGTNGQLENIVLATGERCARSGLFFSNGHRSHCAIPETLGCYLARTGEVRTDLKQRTHIPGLYVAGDASIDTHFVSVAVGEGAKAAVSIHVELLSEEGRV